MVDTNSARKRVDGRMEEEGIGNNTRTAFSGCADDGLLHICYRLRDAILPSLLINYRFEIENIGLYSAQTTQLVADGRYDSSIHTVSAVLSNG